VNEILSPKDEYTEGDIVVDTHYADLVLELLEDEVLRPDVTVTATASDDNLDLSLITLDGARDHADRTGRLTEGAEIQAVLATLREILAAKYAGWEPEMDGNPWMTGVVGFGHTRPMAKGVLMGVDPPPWASGLTGTDGAGVRIAVLDTGLAKHPVLDGHARPAADYWSPTATPVPAWQGHGTFVSGLIAQAAPGCDIVVHQVLHGQGRATTWQTAVALGKLAEGQDPYDIVNLSLGCRIGGTNGPLALRRAVALHEGRSLLVAAAGNHGQSGRPLLPVWPAALPGVVAVGSTRRGDGPAMAHLSPITPLAPWLDCCAVGEEVVSTFVGGPVLTESGTIDDAGFASWSGTSFAAARVSGLVAAAMAHREPAAEALERLLDDPRSGIDRFDRRTARHAG